MNYRIFYRTSITLLLSIMTLNASHAQSLVWSQVLKSIRSTYPAVHQISIDSLARRLEDPKEPTPVLLDVRKPEEYAVSHLGGAIRIDPDMTDFSTLDRLDRNAPIIAYCSVGYRSSELANRLLEAGFTNVSNLEGSIFAWANAGRPVVRGDSVVQAVHPYNSLWGMLLNAELRSYEPED